MDMYTMPLHSVTSSRGTSEMTLATKRSFGLEHDLRKPLISATSFPVSKLPMRLSQPSNLTVSGLPPPVEQCSFSQAVLNGQTN